VTAMKVQEIKMEGEFTNSTKKLGYSKYGSLSCPPSYLIG
jgi:hypothetical protein